MVEGEKIIPVMERIGLLDRKMQVIHQRVKVGNKANWLKYAKMALQSIYGYDWQGDNVMLARENLLMDMIAFYQYKFHEDPEPEVVQEWAEIIAWNIWQMDGLKYVIPNSCHEVPVNCGLDGFGDTSEGEMEPCPGCKHNKYNAHNGVYCKIMDWEKNESFEFRDLVKEGGIMPKKADFKFDVIIGNPPYQDSIETYNRQPPVYPFFYDAAEKVSSKYILVSPARFLFNGGLTSKDWNKKMLSDIHLKVVDYNNTANEVFQNTEIKGGIVIIYRDDEVTFGSIGKFVPNDTLRSICLHFDNDVKNNLPSIMYGGRSDLKFNKDFLKQYPNTPFDRLKAIQVKHPEVTCLAPNEEYELKSSTFDSLPYVFYDVKPSDPKNYYRILGLSGGKRTFRWIEKKYMVARYAIHNNIKGYKVMFSEANGNGQFGETLSSLVVAEPFDVATPTFISVGNFSTRGCAENLLKYIKTKFVRTLLGILKKTHHTAPNNWAYVPLQDFTSKSDIDWSKPVAEIDKQLYKKYKLSKEEIEFIESHVKAMV